MSGTVKSQKFGWHNYKDPKKLNSYNEDIEKANAALKMKKVYDPEY